MSRKHRLLRFVLGSLAALALLAIPDPANAQEGIDAAPGAAACSRTVTAKVVALDQVFFWNRLGAVEPQGMIFALAGDVVAARSSQPLGAGNARLRDGKRPRPIVLRMNVGDCLQVTLFNYLNPTPVDQEQVVTRVVSLRAHGLQLRNSIADDGSFVGKNASSLVAVGGNRTFTFYAEREGGYMLYSMGSTTGGEGDGGQLNAGLFGAVNVQPAGAEWYRSQVTANDLKLATKATTTDGHPIINYNACYPYGQDCALTPDAKPILKMLRGTEIVHTDLTAIISGPKAGRFPTGTYPAVQVEPDRDQPFREFTIIYHDEVGAVQAFPQFEDPPKPAPENPLKFTLHSVRDAFAINYGTGGIGAEILANRLGVGPMANCTECRYEEFFLTSWAVGDPAMVVDIPANVPCTIEDIRKGNLNCGPKLGFKATKAFYPDDPSNVYHTYIGDHTKFRVMHGGSKEHHIHHLHAHQWVHTPDDPNSAYLDSQALGPGSAFTTEITYNGSGNRNKVVGDSIFHCHFYPHFAMGMWSLWRSHDVFESGTVLDAEGRPAFGSRALPDAEILAGTPIPALVPLPTRPMAPLPEAQASIVNGQVKITGTGNPGFPFFIPAVAGHRPPTPPLDVVDDGGLPRHIITGGTFTEVHNRLDFSKNLITANAVARKEEGEPVEKAAMAYHGQRSHATFTPEGLEAKFITNGLPRKTPANPSGAQQGAPYADPCINDEGQAVGVERFYKAAGIQLDVRLNKAGWHFPQQRILALWGDVADLRGTAGGFAKPPEPFFFRANTNDCITFHHTNLLPAVYELDDFQVRTPTDIIGQHIHLVKFDVTSSDGSGNGWNYEDGTLAPDEVIERIKAINATGGLIIPPIGDGPTIQLILDPKEHPFFHVKGAQTTIQRWYADNTLNNNKVDRTLRTVFTHDHFGPSTHQQVGLYAGLVIEPEGSTWRDPDTGVILGGQGVTPPRLLDGGPTSWRVDVWTKDTAFSYREFMLEFADFQHAYLPGTGGGVDNPHPDPAGAINPPAKEEAPLPINIQKLAICHGGDPAPCPEAISAAEPGTFVVNYRNEPIPLRIRDPHTNKQVVGEQGDLSHVFRSIKRVDEDLNQHNAYPPFYQVDKDVDAFDPFTRLLRAYEHDRVQIRILVGAHEEGHNFTVHGIKWLFEPGTPEDPLSVNNSGYRNSQMMGISEHFEFIVPNMPNKMTEKSADYLYRPGAAVDGGWNGLWGIMRVFKGAKGDLQVLPNNVNARAPILSNQGDFDGVCLKAQAPRQLNVTAVLAKNILPQKTLVYNPRLTVLKDPNHPLVSHKGPLHDPTAIMYVRSEDLDPLTGKLKAGVPIEPLILRANVGDCIDLTLTNKLPATAPDLAGWNTMPMLIEKFNANQVLPSTNVGLHPQLLFYDVTNSDGFNVGFNPVQTAAPGFSVKYRWYAGELKIDKTTSFGSLVPIEFGGTNLISSDPIKHSNKGAFGSLIILPKGKIPLGAKNNWVEDTNSRARANVYDLLGNVAFRDFVLMHQTDVNLRFGEGSTLGDGTAVPSVAEKDDVEDTAQKAFNYRTEPLWFRLGFMPDIPFTGGEAGPGGFSTRDIDFSNAVSNSVIPACLSIKPMDCKDPVTPIFTATAGQQARIHVLNAGGHGRNNVFVLHGHVWREEPYLGGSKTIGANPLSEWSGAQFGVGATFHFDAVLRNGAGGRFKVPGDYLYRTFQSFQFHNGLWGIFRVFSPLLVTDPALLDPAPVQ
ncbi:MAG: copper oxidase [Acidobacteriota bacterium]